MPMADQKIITDSKRLKALHDLLLLDTPAEAAFDRVAQIARRLLDAPVALVTLVDADRQFFKSAVGLREPYASERKTPLSHSFCQHVVAQDAPLNVYDARQDPLVSDNPAIEDLDVIAYLGVPLVLPSGYVIGSLCVIDNQPHRWNEDDVDALKELAEIVMDEIALRSEVRYHQKTQHELLLATQERETLRLLNQVVRQISHDLSQPISSLNIKLTLLERDLDSERRTLRLQQVNEKLQEMASILNRFTTFWQLERGAQTQHKSLALNRSIDEVLAMIALKPQFYGRIGAIERQLDAYPDSITGNRAMIEVVLVHIIENALYHTSAQDTIMITTRTEADAIVLSISDTGEGIPTDDLPRIVEPFYRADKARKSEYGRIGLGLAVTQHVLRMHNASIEIESTPGSGTTVTIRWPSSDKDSEPQGNLHG